MAPAALGRPSRGRKGWGQCRRTFGGSGVGYGAGVASTGGAAKRHSELRAAPIRHRDGDVVLLEGWPEADMEHTERCEAALAEYERTGDRSILVELGLVPAR